MSERRPDSRRDYRHFPPDYANALRAFERDGTFTIGPLDKKSAAGCKRDLYRFRMFLTAALDTDPGDDYARSLFDIFNTASLRTVNHDDDTQSVVFELNPVVAAMRRLNGSNVNG